MQHQDTKKDTLKSYTDKKSTADTPLQSTALKLTPFQSTLSKLTPEEIDSIPSFINWPTRCTKAQQAVINKLMKPVEKKTIAKEEVCCKI